MDKIKMRILLAGTFALLVLLCAERVTGSVLHLLIGVVLLAVTVIHMRQNKQKWAYRRAGIRTIDKILAGALILMPLSGIVLHMSGTLPGAKIVHKLAGTVFIFGIIAHIWQHRREKGKAGKIDVSQKLNEGVSRK